jgi:hypothetical protein
MRRVLKSEVKRDTWAQPEPLDLCLDCWKNWLAGDSDKDLGVKSMRLLRGDGDGYGQTASEAQQQRDNEIGAATDAMIDSLSALHRWAIYSLCGIPTVWKYPNADLFLIGPEARESLAGKLKKNVCTSVLF